MNVLVVNCGSSSLKSEILDHKSGERILKLRVERIGEVEPRIKVNGGDWEPLAAKNHQEAIPVAVDRLIAALPPESKIEVVAHRVVHGGAKFDRPTEITEEVIEAIEATISLAPLHNPANLAGIRVALELLPDLPHIAVFDTAFHSSMPRRAKTYAIPNKLAEEKNFKRFGFHGTSHHYVANKAAQYLEQDSRDLRIITCHLGNGSSIAAVEYGRSAETSMGMTPVEGLVMGTRAGDIDAGILIQMLRDGMTVDELDHFANKECGLAGLSGVGNDMRDIELRAADGDEACRMAIQVFTHRLRKYIGAYAAVMGGVDVIVFTAGIGENSSQIRHRSLQRLEFLGAILDEDANRESQVGADEPVVEISRRNSRCKILVVATDEQLQLAREAAHVVIESQRTRGSRTIPVAVSARHVHLTQDAVDILFGEGYQLTERNPLSQPNQFACNEQINIIGPKRTIENVRILGPTRPKIQVEISRTDEFFLGIDAPIRASGDVANTPGCVLEGPAGKLEIKDGVICAWRHIHMTPDDAEYFEVQDKDVVEVAITSAGRDLVFGDVLVRVSPKYRLEMHIDTDEGNAAELSRGASGALVPTEGKASLTRRRTRYDR